MEEFSNPRDGQRYDAQQGCRKISVGVIHEHCLSHYKQGALLTKNKENSL